MISFIALLLRIQKQASLVTTDSSSSTPKKNSCYMSANCRKGSFPSLQKNKSNQSSLRAGSQGKISKKIKFRNSSVQIFLERYQLFKWSSRRGVRRKSGFSQQAIARPGTNGWN
jgi:hypothetical protein